MILTRLTINDFGVFHGEHTIDLSPRNHRPIILFGGKNGAGKSTVLEAIRLCLYGPGALGVSVGKEEYLHFLSSRIHSNPNALIQPSFASILVEFQYSHSFGLATYKVTRAWERRNGNKTTEVLSIERNGKTLEEVEAENPNLGAASHKQVQTPKASTAPLAARAGKLHGLCGHGCWKVAVRLVGCSSCRGRR